MNTADTSPICQGLASQKALFGQHEQTTLAGHGYSLFIVGPGGADWNSDRSDLLACTTSPTQTTAT